MKIINNHNVTSIILLAVVLVATPQLHGAEPDGPKIDRRVFLDTDGKAIRDAQMEIEAAKLEWENRLRKLAIHLEAEGWEPRQDSDYQGWAARLEQLREDQAILKRKTSEAFIAFVKFRLSPDAKSDQIYHNKLKDALSGADALGTQYRQLQNVKTPRGYSDKVTVKKSLTTHVNTGVNPSVTQENLKAAEANLQGNINEYKKTLSGLGRNLNNTTIHEWELLARDVGVDRQKLEENLKQAFLWSEKFRLAPSAGHKAELAARVSEGNELVSEISSRYHELMKIKTTS